MKKNVSGKKWRVRNSNISASASIVPPLRSRDPSVLRIRLASRAVAARETAVNKPPPIGAAGMANSGTSAPPKIKSTAPAKKDQKRALKGVLVKKKSKPTTSEAQEAEQKKTPKEDKSKSTDGDEREAKRRKVSAS